MALPTKGAVGPASPPRWGRPAGVKSRALGSEAAVSRWQGAGAGPGRTWPPALLPARPQVPWAEFSRNASSVWGLESPFVRQVFTMLETAADTAFVTSVSGDTVHHWNKQDQHGERKVSLWSGLLHRPNICPHVPRTCSPCHECKFSQANPMPDTVSGLKATKGLGKVTARVDPEGSSRPRL